MLSLENVAYHYGDDLRFQLKPIDMTIATGEVVALAGKSGSGKTTLLKLMAGLLSPTNGSLFYFGEKLVDPSSKLIRGYSGFTIVHQDFELFPRYTVSQNIAHPLRHLDAHLKEERVKELLVACDIESVADARIIEISGGQKQRTAIATALAGDPEVLIMDEPFSNLDQFNKQRLSESLKAYIDENEVTTILSSHDPVDILGFADRVALLDEGQLVATNTPFELYSKPSNEEVARLFGDVNVLNNNTFEFYDLNVSKGKKALIRPSHIKLSPKGKYEALVVGKIFSGWFFQLILSDSHNLLRVYLQEGCDYEEGDRIKFDILKDKINYVY